MADLIVTITIVLFVLWGAKRGFIRSLVGFTSTFVSMILSAILFRPVSYLLSTSPIGDSVQESMRDFLGGAQNGVEVIIDEFAVKTASLLVLNVISFIVVLIIAKIAVALIVNAINLTAKLPIIRNANSILGAITGFVTGLLVCYIVIGSIGALSNDDTFAEEVQSIEESFIAVNFYYDNVVTKVLTGFMD